MTEGTPQISEEFRQLNRSLMEKVIDKAASDPEWKQLLLDDPGAAMLEANFPEAWQLQQIERSAAQASQEGEVTGHQGWLKECFLNSRIWD